MSPKDKELIRLASRAFFESEDEATHALVSLGWNPLASNEDAFMLATWLNMIVATTPTSVVVGVNVREGVYQRHFLVSDFCDKYAATRRCILEVGAEIGRRTP